MIMIKLNGKKAREATAEEIAELMAEREAEAVENDPITQLTEYIVDLDYRLMLFEAFGTDDEEEI